METPINIVRLRQSEAIDAPLTEVLRAGARRLFAQAVALEADAFLSALQDLRRPDGCARLVRHGHGPERAIQTGIGPVARVRVRDRGGAGPADRVRFPSTRLPKWARRTRILAALLPVLYLRGISTNDFQEALAALLGRDAPTLSPAVIARLTARWADEDARWQGRDLSARRHVSVWADGVDLQARMEDQAACRLVLIGSMPEGRKQLVGFQVGAARAPNRDFTAPAVTDNSAPSPDISTAPTCFRRRATSTRCSLPSTGPRRLRAAQLASNPCRARPSATPRPRRTSPERSRPPAARRGRRDYPCGRALGGPGRVGGRSGFDLNQAGVLVGADKQFDGGLLGVSFGYADGTTTGVASPNRSSAGAYQGSVYGAFAFDAVFVDAVAAYTHTDNRTSRGLSFGDLSRTAIGSFGGGDVNTAIRLGTRTRIGAPYAEPSVGLDWDRLSRDGVRRAECRIGRPPLAIRGA